MVDLSDSLIWGLLNGISDRIFLGLSLSQAGGGGDAPFFSFAEMCGSRIMPNHCVVSAQVWWTSERVSRAIRHKKTAKRVQKKAPNKEHFLFKKFSQCSFQHKTKENLYILITQKKRQRNTSFLNRRKAFLSPDFTVWYSRHREHAAQVPCICFIDICLHLFQIFTCNPITEWQHRARNSKRDSGSVLIRWFWWRIFPREGFFNASKYKGHKCKEILSCVHGRKVGGEDLKGVKKAAWF